MGEGRTESQSPARIRLRRRHYSRPRLAVNGTNADETTQMLQIGAGCVTIFISPQPLSCYPKASHHVFAAAFIWKGGPVSRFIGGFGKRSSEERSRPDQIPRECPCRTHTGRLHRVPPRSETHRRPNRGGIVRQLCHEH